MLSHYDSIYLSPHLDDVALSCAGQINQQIKAGRSILIVTITAGNPPIAGLSDFAKGLHQRWERVSEAVATRRLEDKLACERLGADFLQWPFSDCIYRLDPHTGRPLYASEKALFGPLHPTESTLVKQLAQSISELPDWEHFLIPLSVGNHVDHQLARRAAEHFLGSARPIYYEEYPYAQNADILELLSPPDLDWQPKIIPLSKNDLNAKIEAIACYRSQLSTFFTDLDDLVKQVTEYHIEIGGERLWQIAKQEDQFLTSTQEQLLY
jgi:LmbE family N-acetylglucosaminyl deacetylase